jgi:hypothetical protein
VITEGRKINGSQFIGRGGGRGRAGMMEELNILTGMIWKRPKCKLFSS